MVGRLTSPRFVGRREELDALRAALDRAAEGCGSVALVGGEAGIGKSRLIAKLAAHARRDGAMVLIGECLPLGDGELLYAPIVGALRSLARERGIDGLAELASSGHDELARLLSDLAAPQDGPPAEGSQARLFEQLLAVFTAVARAAPLLVVVEDLHWSDRATRDFLSFLVRAARDEPIALAVTYRSDEVARAHPALGFVHELERSGHAVTITLTAFDRKEIREQVTAIRGQDPDPLLVDRLLERAEGNPFFTEELLASAPAPDAPLPETLRQALLLRLADSPEDVAAVVRTIAVAGKEIEHTMLEAVLDLPHDRLVSALRDAAQRHVVVHRPESTKYAFRHALLCEAAYSDLLPVERQRVHRSIAEAIERRPQLGGTRAAATAKLSHHWYAAGELRSALHASVDAAIEAELVYAPGEALLHYERALELWDVVSPSSDEVALDRLGLLRRASEAAAMVGESDRAIALAREMLERVDRAAPVAVALAHGQLGRRLWTAGRGVDALPEQRRAVELMPARPTPERSQVIAAEAQVLMLCHRISESESRCQEALALAREVGARHVEANVLNTMCANFCYAGCPERGVEAAAQARAIAKELGLIEEIGRSYVNGGDALDHAGRIEESMTLAMEGLEVCRELGVDRWFGDCLRGEIAGRLLRTGDWDRAAELIDELFQRVPTGINAGNAYGIRAVLHAQRGDRAQTWEAVACGEEYVQRSGGSMWRAPMAEARATIELWDGLPGEAASTVEACLAAVAGGESVLSTVRLYELGVRAAADLALAGVAGEPATQCASDRAAALLTRVGALVASLAGPAPIRVRASRQAAIAERSRIVGSDPAAWDEAAALWRKYGDRYQVAYAQWRRAEALLTVGGERGVAQDGAREAHRIAVGLGAQPLVAAIETLARRGRLDLGDRTDAERDETNAALGRLELTPRELEVLALVGEGMTNREIGSELFITDKTASVHVSRILAKLSVSNRAAAAAAAQRLGVERVAAAAG